MKSYFQYFIQKLLGYQNYLFLFSLYSSFKIQYLKDDKEFRYFLKLAKQFEGNTIVDIGANIGITVSILAKHFPQHQIIAFEPVARNFQTLSSVVNYQGLKNVILSKTAIGETNKEIEIATPVYQGVIKQGLSHIKGSHGEYDVDLMVETCQMKTLDSALQEFGSNRIAAVKIDVENYEYMVLCGAIESFQRFKPLVFAELWDDDKKIACIEKMQSIGYVVKVLIDDSLVEYDHQTCLNYFFIPAEKK